MLVADLVFLQALWLIFTLCMGYWMKWKDDESDHCLGCLQRMGQVQGTSEQARYEKLGHAEVTKCRMIVSVELPLVEFICWDKLVGLEYAFLVFHSNSEVGS